MLRDIWEILKVILLFSLTGASLFIAWYSARHGNYDKGTFYLLTGMLGYYLLNTLDTENDNK